MFWLAKVAITRLCMKASKRKIQSCSYWFEIGNLQRWYNTIYRYMSGICIFRCNKMPS